MKLFSVGIAVGLLFCGTGAEPPLEPARAHMDAAAVCKTSTSHQWQNIGMGGVKTGIFTALVDVTPTSTGTGIVALTNGWAAAYRHAAVTARFGTDGTIKARDGSTDRAVGTVPFTNGTTYTLRYEVNLLTRRFSLYSRPSGGSESTVATNFRFRSEQNQLTRLDNIAVHAETGSLAACYGAVDTVPPPPPPDTVTPPTITALVVTPSTATVDKGATKQFTATATWSDGQSHAFTRTWTATGGAISTSGLYTAGQIAGTAYQVIGSAGGKADTAIVSVTEPQVAGCLRTVNVASMAALTTALNGSLPGDCIMMAAGTYGLAGGLTIGRSGTAAAPIVIQGPGSTAILDLNQQIISLRASYIHLRKFRMTDFPGMGLWMYGVTGAVIDSMEFDHSGHELMALKDASHHNIIKNSWFHDSGILVPSFGEGIYISNWGGTGFPLQFTNTDNQILNNRFGPNVRSEGIDLKEGADRTTIRGNSFSGLGAPPGTGSGALISVISSNNIIDGNTLQYGRPDGIDFFASKTVTMTGNMVSNNFVDLQNIHNVTRPEGRWAFWITFNSTPSNVTIKCSNTMINGGTFSNVPCVP